MWSPDSQKIAYFDNSQSVYWLDVEERRSKKIASQPIYGPVVIISYAWSPDSKWLAYAMDNPSMITTVYVYSIEQAKSFQVSDGLSDVSEPVVRQERQVSLLLRLDRRRAGEGLVRAVERRHARRRRGSTSPCCRTTCLSPLAQGE